MRYSKTCSPPLCTVVPVRRLLMWLRLRHTSQSPSSILRPYVLRASLGMPGQTLSWSPTNTLTRNQRIAVAVRNIRLYVCAFIP